METKTDDQKARECADAFRPLADAAERVHEMLHDDGGPAYPQPAVMNQGCVDYADETGRGGMTLRDYFAAKAMQGLIAIGADPDMPASVLSKHAYMFADAMIAARKVQD